MLKKKSLSFILRLIKWILPVVFIILFSVALGNHLLNNGNTFKKIDAFFLQFKYLFFIWHGVFYAFLYWIWPKLILFISNQQKSTPNSVQVRCAIQARGYLIGILLVFELLNLLR